MSLYSRNRLVSSANIIIFNKLEALGRPFIYIKNNSGPRIDPCGNPHVTFSSFVLLSLLMQIYKYTAFYLLDNFYTRQDLHPLFHRSQAFSKVLYDRLYQTPLTSRQKCQRYRFRSQMIHRSDLQAEQLHVL